MKTFVGLILAGHLKPDQIDDWVEAWHNSETSDNVSLPESLGMTRDEYASWAQNPDALTEILALNGYSPDIEAPGLKIKHGEIADAQESDFQNATLFIESDTAISIAVEPPKGWIEKNSFGHFNEDVKRLFAPLLAAGWNVEIRRGPEVETNIEDIIEEQKDA